jgi:pilus assembly protein Flp/PilA
MCKRYLSKITAFLADESGPTAVEYAVMLALILAVCIAAIATLGTSTASSWADSSNQMETFMNGN